MCCDYRAAHMVYCGCALIFQPLLGIMLQWMLLCMPFGRKMCVCVCVFIYFVNELVSYKLCMLSFFPMTASLHCPRITIWEAGTHLCWHLVILVEVCTSVMFWWLLYIFSARDWTRACSFEMIVNVHFLMSNDAELVLVSFLAVYMSTTVKDLVKDAAYFKVRL